MTLVDRLRVVFLGTPEFAVPTLEALIAHPNLDVVAVVTQPDRPAGRNQKTHVPPTKRVALLHSIPVLQPESLAKSPETVEMLNVLNPDLIVMVAFGQILKKAVLKLPRLGVVNLHASLLPSYRGAAPINWAIINGDRETGITTMFTDPGVDTGPILLKSFLPIDPDINAEELAAQMSTKGAKLVVETIEKLTSETLAPEKQDDTRATYAPILTKEMGEIDWKQSASHVHNLVRGLIPWPGAFTFLRGEPLKIWKTSTELPSDEFAKAADHSPKPGTIIVEGKAVLASCGSSGADALRLLEVQPVNRARMSAFDWYNGARLAKGEGLGV
jgi:methionyl-tRNA formyltransferase